MQRSSFRKSKFSTKEQANIGFGNFALTQHNNSLNSNEDELYQVSEVSSGSLIKERKSINQSRRSKKQNVKAFVEDIEVDDLEAKRKAVEKEI